MEQVSSSRTSAAVTPKTSQLALYQVPCEMLAVSDLVLHPEASRVPRMREDERTPFIEDVKARGVQDAIIVQKPNIILDGRHRWEGAKERGDATIPAKVVDLGDKEQLDILFGAAMHRRNQTDDQRAIVAAYWYQQVVKLSKQERASKAGKARSKSKGSLANDVSAKPSKSQAQSQTANSTGASAETAVAKERTERLDEKLAREYGVPNRKMKYALQLVKETQRLARKVINGELTLTGAKKEMASTIEASTPKTTKKAKPKKKPAFPKKQKPADETPDETDVAVVEDGDFRMTLSRPFDIQKLANELFNLLGHEGAKTLETKLIDLNFAALGDDIQ